jgi:carbamoyl-phosphate synthase large subunit
VVRPSYVLGGRAMAIVYDTAALDRYMRHAVQASPEHPILVDKFLEDATEIDVDAIADASGAVVIGGIMEHIEQAGIHSGDSSCVIPPFQLSDRHVATIRDYTRRIARALNVVGLMNTQFAVKDDVVYVLEVNPRASRTVPYLSKATGVPLAKIAARLMIGRTLAEIGLTDDLQVSGYFVKTPVFPFVRFPGVDTLLGPEMKSTGEVMGIDSDFGRAYAKAQIEAGNPIPKGGRALVSLRREDRGRLGDAVHWIVEGGFTLVATPGTARELEAQGFRVDVAHKVGEGHPDVVEEIEAGKIDLVFNTVSSDPRAARDSLALRRAALQRGLPYFTTLAALRAAAGAIRATRLGSIGVRSLQEIHPNSS